ncbi:MAG: hypothetical protein KIT82_01305 [Bradyrhizobium sp.]|nr:hypothetical protein [Bradyrhizobium sp.]
MSRHATGGAQKQKQPRRNAAEQERTAAERAKKIEQEKTAAAERTRLEEQEKARLAAEKAKQAEQEKVASEKEAERKEQLAALPPPTEKSEPSEIDLPRALQSELRRVGCNTSAVDGAWNEDSQKALDLFNRHAGLKLDFRVASVDALDAVKGKSGRICPVACDAGFRADGERCISIVCKSGFRLNDDNECEKNPDKKPIAKSKEPKRKPADRAKADAASAKPQASRQIYCDGQGCRAAPKGAESKNQTSLKGIRRTNNGVQLSV